jgi:protein TonB
MLIEDRAELRRWGGALTLVVLVHAAPALVAACWPGSTISPPASEPSMLIDMAPPAAPPMPPSEQPAGPKQIKAEVLRPKQEDDPSPSPPIEHLTVALPIISPQLPRQESQQIAARTTAPAARPMPPAEAPSAGKVTWQGLVLGRLEKFKRYPSGAQARRQQGAPYIRFVMDRDGKVISSILERSSGFSALDKEATSLPRRAQPFPKPPPDVAGETIELVVPVEFFMK